MEKAIIELYGVIEATGENSALSFKKRLKDAVKNKAKEIELHIHCPGGSVFEGYAIYNAIKASAIPIDAYIDGISASMATVIMLATRKVYMAENAFIMIHAPFVASAGGNAKELRKNAEMLEKIEKLQIEVYKAKTGKSEEYVKKWLVGDNWFNAEEAHEEKLIDEITGKSDINTTDEDTEITSLSAKSLLQKFEAKRTPEKDDLQKFKTQIFDILQFNSETWFVNLSRQLASRSCFPSILHPPPQAMMSRASWNLW